MPEAVKVTLEPPSILLQSGGDTAEVIATVQNVSEVLDQYDIEIEGLDRSWYTIHAPTVGLYTGDHSDVRITLHPPKRPDIRAGDYPFLVKAVSQVSRDRTGSAKGFLKIQPFAVFKPEIKPERARGRRGGSYRVAISNSGNADLTLDLRAADREGGCCFDTNPETLVVAPGERASASIYVRPKRSWLTGPRKLHDFTVTLAPQGARGDVKTVGGSFEHRPLMRSGTTLLGSLKTLLVLAILVAGVLFALNLGGGVSGYQAGLGKLWKQATDMVGGLTGSGSAPKADKPTFAGGFKEMHDVEPALVGEPVENVTYDRAGNGYQNTTTGTLFWFKSGNTVYFFSRDEAYVFRDGRATTIDRKPR